MYMFNAIYRSFYRDWSWIASVYCLERTSLLPLPSSAIAPLAEASPPAHAGGSAARKARFWDRIAVKYAADPIGRVQGLLSADQDVLEIGCGTGTTALRLAPFTRRLMATDVSAGLIAIAREKLAAEPVPQLSFDIADADATVAGQGEYDVALAFNLLHLVTDLDRALELAMRALRPGGLLISKTACISEMNPLIPYLALPLMRVIGKAPPVLCFDADALRSAIARQGMDIVSVERHGTRGKDIRVFIVARKPT
jgi:SAM-dependent methyltransferase